MTHDDLLKRLREATGADRAIDGHLAVLDGWEWHGDGTVDEHETFAGHWQQPGFAGSGTFGKRGRGLCDCNTIRPEEGNSEDCQPYTASLDSAIGLVERMLPFAIWSLHSGDPRTVLKGATAFIYRNSDDDDDAEARAIGPTPALALLIALLEALNAKEQAKP